jgi:hypothetical protein
MGTDGDPHQSAITPAHEPRLHPCRGSRPAVAVQLRVRRDPIRAFDRMPRTRSDGRVMRPGLGCGSVRLGGMMGGQGPAGGRARKDQVAGNREIQDLPSKFRTHHA